MNYGPFFSAIATEPARKPGRPVTATDILRDIADVFERIGADEIDAETSEHVRSLRPQRTQLGEKIFVNPILDNMPKMQLTPAVYDNLPWPFRDEINAWMRDFFGTESKVYHVQGVGIFMGRKAYEQLQEHVL